MKPITKIRKEVTAIANRSRKRFGSLAAAMRNAWQVVKGRRLVANIAGVTLYNRQSALRRLESYAPEVINVRLEREADNQYDPNAIKVQVSVTGGEYKMGYMPKAMAALLAPIMDMGITLAASWKAVTGGYETKENRGGLIAITL